MDKAGAHYIFPVQAKGGRDFISVVQIAQDFELCAAKFPTLVARSIAAQFMDDQLIAMFELERDGAEVRVNSEKHYRLVDHDDLDEKDLQTYRAPRPEILKRCYPVIAPWAAGWTSLMYLPRTPVL